MTKLQSLYENYGRITVFVNQPTTAHIHANPCYSKKDIVLAMYELVGEAVPTELWNKLAEEHVTPTGTITVSTDRAEDEKNNATLFSDSTYSEIQKLFGN